MKMRRERSGRRKSLVLVLSKKKKSLVLVLRSTLNFFHQVNLWAHGSSTFPCSIWALSAFFLRAHIVAHLLSPSMYLETFN